MNLDDTTPSDDRRLTAAITLAKLETAVSQISFDVVDLKTTIRSQAVSLQQSMAEMAKAVTELSKWSAAHDAVSAAHNQAAQIKLARIEAHDTRLMDLEQDVGRIKDRQETARTVSIPLIIGTIFAVGRELWTMVKN